MKPVLIIQHASGHGPGYLTRFLERNGVPFEIHAMDQQPVADVVYGRWLGHFHD